MSGCECKPDAKRKRDSAQPQGKAQPSSNARLRMQARAERERDSAKPDVIGAAIKQRSLNESTGETSIGVEGP
jgi:hypothetical protein